MPEQQSNYREILDEIRKLVRLHYENSQQPYFLSSLGNDLLETFQDLKSTLKERSISSVLTEIQEITVIRHPHSPQKIVVALTEDAAWVRERLESYTQADKRNSILKPTSLHRALLFAFQQTPSDDQDVFVSLGPPIRYHVIPKASPVSTEGMYRIPKEFLIPTNPFSDIEALPMEKRNSLLQNIKRWMGENNIPFQKCYYVRRAIDTSNLLLKLIDAQPEDMRSRLVVPADVILKLLARN